MEGIRFTVFTKPWKTPIEELAPFVAGLGFNGVELPVRPGYPVNPENMSVELPKAAKLFDRWGLKIESIAGPTDEKSMAACAEAGVPIIRICVGYGSTETYLQAEARLQREYDQLAPLLEKHGVTLGIQNHSGPRDICNAQGLRALIGKYDPKQIAAVWDAAHNALQGEQVEAAIDIVASHLCMVNLKNAYWERSNGPEAEVAEWRIHWTSGRHGLASWPRVAAELKRRNYRGVVCLPAEYSDEASVNRLTAEDIAFAKSLFG